MCSCYTGYQFKNASNTKCEDINECNLPNDCHPFAECFNTNGSYYCQCKAGYNGDGITHCISKYSYRTANKLFGYMLFGLVQLVNTYSKLSIKTLD